MKLDLDKVRANVERASTTDLMDRATVYRAGMEPEALSIIEEELEERGVTPYDLSVHGDQLEGRVVRAADGWPVRCRRCDRPATTRIWGWHRLWGRIPLFPRRLALCDDHRPREPEPDDPFTSPES